jgi:hypothetical protein
LEHRRSPFRKITQQIVIETRRGCDKEKRIVTQVEVRIRETLVR